MNNKILILFPSDESTLFLEPVIRHLFHVISQSHLVFLKSNSNLNLRNKLMRDIGKIDCNTILYLGHGNSDHLGSLLNFNDDGFILNKRELNIFSNKNVIYLSCNSTELLQKTKNHGYVEGIGFGDLPTGWPDISSVREYNPHAYKGINDKIIDQFKECIVSIMKWSLQDYLIKELSMVELYNLIVLRINKRISNLYKKDHGGNEVLNDILFAMKKEMKYISNK